MRALAAFIFLYFFASLPVFAKTDFENGVQAARVKNWTEAEVFFRSSIEKAPLDAHAFYNLGTSLAAQRKDAEAIWALEKALKLDPTLKSARTNLQFCYTRLGFPEAWEPAQPYFQDKAYQLGIDSWTYISVALGIISSALIFIFIISEKAATRKISLIFAVFTTILLLFTLRTAWVSYDFRYSNTHAILLYDESSVFHDAQGNMKFDLYLKRGSRYEVQEITNDRVGLMMKNQTVVWVDKSMVKTI